HNQTREKQENKLRLSIKKLIDSYAKGFISQEEFEPRITIMKQHLKEIEEEKEKVLDQKKLQQELSLVTDSLTNFSSSVESKLDLVDWQIKQNIIRMLIHQIEINHNHLYIVFRIKSLANFDQNSHNRIMQCCTSRTSNKDNIANLEFKRVIPRELLRQKAGAEFVYNVDLGGFYE
ncbi:MAG: hypothetical protein ACEY3F_02050, partial [Wolbachia sp.]